MSLTRPELFKRMRIKKEGRWGANLAWMVTNRVPVNIPQQDYWPAADPPPRVGV